MTTYRTLDGALIDIDAFTEEERAHFEAVAAAYRAGMRCDALTALARSNGNPQIRAAGGVNRVVWAHPLFRATRDMEDRACIRDGRMAPEPGDDLESDPFAPEEWVPVSEAARRKGVTVAGVHNAIRSGALLARPAKPGGSWLVVSATSLDHWNPSRLRQAARLGRQRNKTAV